MLGVHVTNSLFKKYNNLDKIAMDTDNEIMGRLKFIGQIKKGDKINVRHMQIQSDTMLTRISRTFLNPDTRSNTLTFFRNTINRCFEIVINYSKNRKPSTEMKKSNILQDMEKAKIGLVNIKDTYANDVKFCCDIDILLQDIDAKIIDIDPNYSIKKVGYTPQDDGLKLEDI